MYTGIRYRLFCTLVYTIYIYIYMDTTCSRGESRLLCMHTMPSPCSGKAVTRSHLWRQPPALRFQHSCIRLRGNLGLGFAFHWELAATAGLRWSEWLGRSRGRPGALWCFHATVGTQAARQSPATAQSGDLAFRAGHCGWRLFCLHWGALCHLTKPLWHRTACFCCVCLLLWALQVTLFSHLAVPN